MHIVLSLWHKLHLLPWGLRQMLLPKQEENDMLQLELKKAMFHQFSLVPGEENNLKINKNALNSCRIPVPSSSFLVLTKLAWLCIVVSPDRPLNEYLDISPSPSCKSEVSKPRESAKEIWPRAGGAVACAEHCNPGFGSDRSQLPASLPQVPLPFCQHLKGKLKLKLKFCYTASLFQEGLFLFHIVAPQPSLWRCWNSHLRRKKCQGLLW